MKWTVSSTLAALDIAQAAEQARRWARRLVDELWLESDIGGLSHFTFRLPNYVMASLLGIPEALLPQTARWTGEFVMGLASASRQEQVEQGNRAADNLLDLFQSILTAQQTEVSSGLLCRLARAANAVRRDDTDAVIANTIGFLSQTFDATAGLIGNALIVLSTFADVRETLIVHPTLMYNFVREVLRFDSPIQNTRRFVAQNGVIAAHGVCAGEMVLVVLAAANRDRSANPHPERFELFRENRQLFTFGVGIQACPGEELATVIAIAALEALIASDFDFDQIRMPVEYRPSVNARIPVFGHR